MHKHTIDLLERLLVASEEGRIQWTEVAGKTAYSYLAGDFVVLIDANAERTTFRLTDAQGRSLEQAGVDDLAAATLGTGISALSAVQSVHAIARRQAMGTDTAIASVLDHLQGLSENPAQDPQPAPAAPKPEAAQEEDATAEPESHSDDAIAAEAKAQDGVAAQDNIEPDVDEAEISAPEIAPVHDLPVETFAPASEPDDAHPTKHDKKRKRSLLNPFGGKN